MLTEEQRKFVVDNEKFIWFVLKKHGLTSHYYGAASLGLCKAAVSFNADKGKFSTFAHQVILNEIRQEMRREKAIKDEQILSIESEIHDTESNITVGDMLSSREDSIGDMEYYIYLCDRLLQIPNIHLRMLKRRINGENTFEIGRMEGVSQSYVSKYLKFIGEYISYNSEHSFYLTIHNLMEDDLNEKFEFIYFIVTCAIPPSLINKVKLRERVLSTTYTRIKLDSRHRKAVYIPNWIDIEDALEQNKKQSYKREFI